MLNPITFSERVVTDFLRYQLTTYPFADDRLDAQMRALLNLEQSRQTPLFRGPFVSLSRAFRAGSSLADLAAKGVVHAALPTLVPHAHLYGHQQSAIESVAARRHTLVATGTGSGKTECFLYPILSHCLTLRDEGAAEGIVAVIVYPMNALAEDQLGRLRHILVGTGISFGMYTGRTPEAEADVSGDRLRAGASRADYEARVKLHQEARQHVAVLPPEERASRKEMRAKPPRILLTNVKQLELLLTRQKDIELFKGARLDYFVFDEAHTFTGAMGAETACLVRRLRSYCGRSADETICIATSATIADPERGAEAGRDFASRFFGVRPDTVALIGEEYQEDDWAKSRQTPGALAGSPGVLLQTVLDAVAGVEAEPATPASVQILKTAFQTMVGQTLDAARWQESLYDRLAANELVYQLASLLRVPRPLDQLVVQLQEAIGRPVPEEEVLAWLALGAASRRGGRPLLRPVLHGFLRGVGGAVVTFPAGTDGPRLWLSSEDAAAADEASNGRHARLQVSTCTTCGQHYFAHSLSDFSFTGTEPGGGEAVDTRRVWRSLDAKSGGRRAVLLDRLVAADDDDDADVAPRHTRQVFLCRHCGAVHPGELDRCDACGESGALVRLFVVRQKEERPEHLTSCVACRSIGGVRPGGWREPARPVRAQAVADVHVLAQSMLHHGERRRLLVFADNRQEAAFQAGWMQDHARRFRLRSLIFEQLEAGHQSVGDLVAALDRALDGDDDLSRALIPEVWRVSRKEAAGLEHANERRRFLRLQVLRELVTGMRQRIGLEPWGRLHVDYLGLDPGLPFFAKWAAEAGCTPAALRDGVATLLDVARRGFMLHDPETRLFSRFLADGDKDVQRGYVPQFTGGPKGLKLSREGGDDDARVIQWVSARGTTAARQCARKWGIVDDHADAFFEELWDLLARDLALLVPVTLTGQRGNPLPGCLGVLQVDSDKILMQPHSGYFHCKRCRRRNARPTPNMACPARNCPGELQRVEESPDNYDLQVLDQRYEMVRAREHSAQVPAEDRELLERAFKGESQLVNTLVCTPTLELGVDIGALDSTLMRNVPPKPANYWQRVGRAGRRHRMAVNLTYARNASHDRAYFAEPLKMLGGLVEPPRFNLRNEPMVRKHVHATVLTALHALVASGLGEAERATLVAALEVAFPNQVKTWLFHENGEIRTQPYDVDAFRLALQVHVARVLPAVNGAFAQGWPEADRAVVEGKALAAYVDDMARQLEVVIRRIERRLRWALDQMARLEAERRRRGTLDADEDALLGRCDRLVKRLKGTLRRGRSEAEGLDETNTMAVLAAEGFLPGYGLDAGTVIGFHQGSRYGLQLRDWELRRPLAMAIREYVPGNLIYANGHRFLPRFFHLQAEPPTDFQVDAPNQAVGELRGASSGSALGSRVLVAVPACDVDLPHQSHISDEEDHRFQLPVTVFGYEQARHSGGRAFTWGDREVTLRRGVHLRLVNVGVASAVRTGGTLGYPLCLVCGQSRSPFASQADLDQFSADHAERCRKPVERVGLFADAVADCLGIVRVDGFTEAYSVGEALRIGTTEVLNVDSGDVQLMLAGRPGETARDVLLFDPMPGGSGLLEQMVGRWGEVVDASLRAVENCPSRCESACIDCMLDYRNAFYHQHLDRHVAARVLRALGQVLSMSHAIPPAMPAEASGEPTNDPEARLRHLLERAGFAAGKAQHHVALGPPLGGTTPDYFFEDPHGRTEGICIYLDGLSRHLHGNPETAQRDRMIREELRSRAYEVIEIPHGHLTDREAMRRHFYRLGRLLMDREAAERFRSGDEWFGAEDGNGGATEA